MQHVRTVPVNANQPTSRQDDAAKSGLPPARSARARASYLSTGGYQRLVALRLCLVDGTFVFSAPSL